MSRLIPFLLLCVFVVGCAPKTADLPEVDPGLGIVEQMKQREMAAFATQEMKDRLYRIGGRIMAANTELCGEKKRVLLGLHVDQITHYEEEWQPALRKYFGDLQGVFIRNVIPGSGADDAGIKRGDIIISVGGKVVPRGRDVRRKVTGMIGEQVKKHGAANIGLLRDGQLVNVVAKPKMMGMAEFELANNPQINAFTDGKRIVVFSGMMRFCKTDDELAVILGHEMAHLGLNHVEAKRGNMILGALIDAILSGGTGIDTGVGKRVGALAYSQDFEREADYIGMYMAARAGYDIDGAADIWRRMAVECPECITHATTHPNTASRFLQLEATAAEIEAKRLAGEPIMPNVQQETAALN